MTHAQSGRGPKVVSDIMTQRVITVREEENLELIESAMERFRFRHVPVVDGDRVVGVLTHRDLLRASASVFDPGGDARTHGIQARFFVADLMTRDPLTVGPDTSVATAAALMMEHKIGCLPVVDAEQKLVGIVTAADMLELVIDLTQGG